MAYYLMVEKKRGLYQPINIKNSKYYIGITNRYKKPCAHTLQEIDEFTMMFNNEIELRELLVQEGTISLDCFEKNLSIRQPNKDEYVKVPYDFLYQDSIEYVANPRKIIANIMERYYRNDFVFLKTLANYFSRTYECRTTAPEVARLVEASLYQGYKHRGLEEIDQNGDLMVTRMLKLLIYKHYEQQSGKIDYKEEVNYRNLHDLIAFVKNYDKKNELTEKKEIDMSLEETGQENNIQSESNLSKAKKLTRSKKKYVLDGQDSFLI